MASLALLILAREQPARGEDFLPYGARTRSYSAWRTYVQGDVRTVGMAGSSVGLADTFVSALDNPAGLAMTLKVGDIHYSSNFIRDAQVQSPEYGIQTYSAGLALNLYPWAFSAGYLSDYREEAVYTLASAPDNPARLTVVTRAMVLSAARVLAHDRLSLGVTLVVAQAARALDFATPRNAGQSMASWTAGATFGALVQLPARFLVGASFSLPMRFSTSAEALSSTPEIPGLFQPVEVPWRLGLGLGVIPNRFLRADLSLHLIGTTTNTALVRDDSALVGLAYTVQPRLGAAYVFADYKELKGTLFVGTYLEYTRVAGASSRLHGTVGLEAKVWIFTAGGAFDLAAGYSNYLYTFGVDLFEIMARLEMIPTAWSPPYGRLFPRPDLPSDAGLAHPLVRDWKCRGPTVDPVQAAIALPEHFLPGLHNADAELKKVGRRIVDLATPAPAAPASPPDGGVTPRK